MTELLLVGNSARDDPFEDGQYCLFDFPQRRQIEKATSTLQKLMVISNFFLKLASSSLLLSSICVEVFADLKATCIPVLKCLIKCCDKDIRLFQTRWGPCFDHRFFDQNCCPGHGTVLQPCGYERYCSETSDLQALIGAVLASKKTVETNLNLCGEFVEKYQLHSLKVRRRFQNFYYLSAKPIWGCFVHHCRQNIDAWIEKWGPEFRHSQFSTNECHGLESRRCEFYQIQFDIPARLYLRHQSPRDLLKSFTEILEQYEKFEIAKTKATRPANPKLTALVRDSIRPILNCFHRHCGGKLLEFVLRWGKSISYCKFNRNCCPGSRKKGSDICPYEFRSNKIR
uniref:Uncharacterized protein n=1 Tax=Spongospora subterranea TaxID=70186 RepID=A0A0H5QYM5_9EUKA|eukprot:CRZ07088.1 hypothetical protein [Spongospora subterranea]